MTKKARKETMSPAAAPKEIQRATEVEWDEHPIPTWEEQKSRRQRRPDSKAATRVSGSTG